ncbi:Rotatin [Eumeta japonica]|uniref:Rotatin n=1 Tax=Eumeta variegata TaxID=151549 RepID=A0A4C1X3S5_EUMVA|nr:Rotatin [Eumeta japonica]
MLQLLALPLCPPLSRLPFLDAMSDETWIRICSCLASLLCSSMSASAYAVHAGFPQTLLVSLQTVRDHLNIQGKPADIIRNSNSDPILRTLYWILIMMDSSMTECLAAKESFAEYNIANSLNKLWPWLMMTEELRDAAMRLLQTFTNNCSKALVCMCACVGGRNLVVEVCALAQREAALASRTHSPHLLIAALTTLAHCTSHHHCRAIMLKTDVIAVVYRVRCTERGRHAPRVWGAWARLAEAASRHADGAARLLELRAHAATTPPARDLLLPALAHAAHHHRATFLQSADLMDLLCAALMSGDPAQVVPAARAVWTLAANNHKAKMTLRSAGVSAAVSCAFQRLQRSRRDSPELLGRAFHLLAYTDSILSIS